MSSIPPTSLEARTDESEPGPEFRGVVEAHERRNLVVLAANHVVLRVAWIFKTESVIMPAFMDAIAGAGWLRGCLPVLNRFGQSVPSLLFAERVRLTRRKKWLLFATSLGMAMSFLSLAALWFLLEEQQRGWLPGVFLLLYFFFFSATGLNQGFRHSLRRTRRPPQNEDCAIFSYLTNDK